ncbi:MAG TPA: N-acetylmuramoyl-L-alanine amidase [Chthonomonadaceae bacterium]|nr:N-acetylmuramoyl-L-alanine amidase [Chthonomonadaceae bacterium]
MQLSYKWLAALPTAFRSGRNGNSVTAFVWHTSEGQCSGDLSTLTGHDGTHNVSAHWYVQRDGTIWHLVDDGDTAFHAGIVDTPEHDNDHTIGVEHEHEAGQDWPQDQINSSALVYAFLKQQYPGADIVRHSQIATFTMYGTDYGRKNDPTDFPSDAFWAAVGALGSEQIDAVAV